MAVPAAIRQHANPHKPVLVDCLTLWLSNLLLAEQDTALETTRLVTELTQATGPVVKRLREEWHDIRRQEVDLLNKKLVHLAPQDLAEIEKAIERIVNKLLHPPLKTLKDEARQGPPHGLIDALKRLFHLGD